MTEAGHHEIEDSSPSDNRLAARPVAPTSPILISTNSTANQHEDTETPFHNDPHDSDVQGSDISIREDDDPDKDTPTPLRMAMFTAMAVCVILACYEGILYIPGDHPIIAALATVLICTTITSLQPRFLGNFVYRIFYAIGFVATVIETAVHEGFSHGSGSHSRSSSRQRSSGSSSPKPRPAVPKKSSRISNMKI